MLHVCGCYMNLRSCPEVARPFIKPLMERILGNPAIINAVLNPSYIDLPHQISQCAVLKINLLWPTSYRLNPPHNGEKLCPNYEGIRRPCSSFPSMAAIHRTYQSRSASHTAREYLGESAVRAKRAKMHYNETLCLHFSHRSHSSSI